MSNLGGYQRITTAIKNVGGPEKAKRLAITAVGGIFVLGGVVGGAAYAGGQRLYKATMAKFEGRREACLAAGRIFTVTADGKDDRGFQVSVGDKVRVLECDDDAVLVELIGDDENPYLISGEFLRSVSDFPEGAL